MTKTNKARFILSSIIVIIIVFSGVLGYRHYQDTQVANQMQSEINKHVNAKTAATVTVPNPKHINITLKGAPGNQVAEIIATRQKINKFKFWQFLTRDINAISLVVKEKYGPGITVSLTDPSNPKKVLYAVKDGRVVYDVNG